LLDCLWCAVVVPGLSVDGTPVVPSLCVPGAADDQGHFCPGSQIANLAATARVELHYCSRVGVVF
jgi:hypothetical protein